MSHCGGQQWLLSLLSDASPCSSTSTSPLPSLSHTYTHFSQLKTITKTENKNKRNFPTNAHTFLAPSMPFAWYIVIYFLFLRFLSFFLSFLFLSSSACFTLLSRRNHARHATLYGSRSRSFLLAGGVQPHTATEAADRPQPSPGNSSSSDAAQQPTADRQVGALSPLLW